MRPIHTLHGQQTLRLVLVHIVDNVKILDAEAHQRVTTACLHVRARNGHDLEIETYEQKPTSPNAQHSNPTSDINSLTNTPTPPASLTAFVSLIMYSSTVPKCRTMRWPKGQLSGVSTTRAALLPVLDTTVEVGGEMDGSLGREKGKSTGGWEPVETRLPQAPTRTVALDDREWMKAQVTLWSASWPHLQK